MKTKFLLGIISFFIFTIVSALPPRPSDTVDDAVIGTGILQHNYVGPGWVHGTVTSTFYNSTHSASKVNGAYMTFKFEGNKIEWYTEKKWTHGIVAISIDGGAETLIDLYSSTEQHILVYSSPVLSTAAPHTFKMRNTGTKNAASTNYFAIHDYFIVHYGIVAAGPTNTSVGVESLPAAFPGGGTDNSAFGYRALADNQTSSFNTAIGSQALPFVYYSSQNTAIGYKAMFSGSAHSGGSTAVGANALPQAGFINTAVGLGSGPDVAGYGNTSSLGAYAKPTASNQVRIGNPEVTSIGGQVSWSTLSDGRFKKDVREDVTGLEFVKNLRPVSYMVDKRAVGHHLGMPDSIVARLATLSKEIPLRQTGFVAQEVDALVKKSGYVFSGVDAPKTEKDLYGIRYSEFVVPLVKAVQELSAQNDTLKTILASQQQQIAEQQKQINQLLNQNGKQGAASKAYLLQNSPNPFSVDTEIKMVLPETANSVHIIVYNLEGKQLKDVLVQDRGNVGVKIGGSEFSAGMYVYTLIVDNDVVDTKRMILTK